MAIRNTGMGGTDWSDGEVLDAVDLNDTFDAETSKVQSLSAFWLNSDLYDVYDDFNSYSTGAFTTNSKWTISNSGDAKVTYTSEIVASTNAGGSTNELHLKANINTTDNLAEYVQAVTNNLDNNKHTWFRIYCRGECNYSSSGNYSRVYLIVGTAYIFFELEELQRTAGTNSFMYTNALIVALGSDNYDIYIGGKKLGSNVNIADLEVGVRAYITDTNSGKTNGNAEVYIDDIRQAKSETS